MTTFMDVTRARLAGQWSRKVREECGLSLRELAREIGVNPATLSRWESGRFKPRPAVALRWLRILEQLVQVLNEVRVEEKAMR